MSLGHGFDSADVTAAESADVSPITFLKLEYDSGTLYLHDGVGTYTWADPVDGSQDWLGVGEFGGISGIEESSILSSFEIELVLSGIDADQMDEVLNQDFLDREITIYVGTLNRQTGALNGTPSQQWHGTCDPARTTHGEQNAIMITAEHELAILDRRNGRTYSDADLQGEYSGDLFCEYLPSMENARLAWRGQGGSEDFGAPNPNPARPMPDFPFPFR